MNSYGSVSLVSKAIYKFLRYMNFFPQSTDPDIADANVRLQLEEEQLQDDHLQEEQLQEEQEKPPQEQVTPANQSQTVNIAIL